METVLEVIDVKKVFSDKTIALNGVSFSVNLGEFIVIAGSNGSGKSVLMSLIANLDEPTEGKIILHGVKAGLVFQDADAQILGETPLEDVLFGIKNAGVKKSEQIPLAEKSLEKVGLLLKKDSPARTLSGGEKRRLSVAGILSLNRDLIIFDEPFANLDWPGVRQVCQILKQLKEGGKTIIVLTHETEKILALADRFIVLDKGEIKFDGTAEEGLKQDLEKYSIKNPLPNTGKNGKTISKIGDLLWL